MPKRRIESDKHAPSAQVTRDETMRDLTRMLAQQDFKNFDEMNAFLQREVMGKPLRRVQATTDRERAEDLVIAASNKRSLPKLRAQAAKALKLDADCIAAHLLLAEVAESPTKALAHCRDAIAAGDRVLADDLSDPNAPMWLVPNGRPYLRARHLYAELLWQMGDRPAALEEARTILRLNADDNQGMRYILIEWLMRAGSVADIDALLAAYDEPSAAWTFTTALHRFRTHGPTADATKALRAAISANAHVAPILLGHAPMPDELPDSYSMGHPSEAIIYVNGAISTWVDAVGALEWLEQVSRPYLPEVLHPSVATAPWY